MRVSPRQFLVTLGSVVGVSTIVLLVFVFRSQSGVDASRERFSEISERARTIRDRPYTIGPAELRKVSAEAEAVTAQLTELRADARAQYAALEAAETPNVYQFKRILITRRDVLHTMLDLHGVARAESVQLPGFDWALASTEFPKDDQRAAIMEQLDIADFLVDQICAAELTALTEWRYVGPVREPTPQAVTVQHDTLYEFHRYEIGVSGDAHTVDRFLTQLAVGDRYCVVVRAASLQTPAATGKPNERVLLGAAIPHYTLGDSHYYEPAPTSEAGTPEPLAPVALRLTLDIIAFP